MTKHYGPEFEKKISRQRELERQVLLYLRSQDGPVNWEPLSVHFDPHKTGDIGPVFHLLKEGQYITVDEQNFVAITKLGLKRLESAMF
jgi:hypothetical protein